MIDENTRDSYRMHAELTKLKEVEKSPMSFDISLLEEVDVRIGGSLPHYSPLEGALLRLQEGGGSPVKQEEPNTPIRRVYMHVAGYDSNNRCLVVSQALNEEQNTLARPTNTRIKDIIGYKTVEDLR